MTTEVDSNTIVYLRPQTDQAIAMLDLEDNKPYEEDVAPLPEPADIPLEGFAEPASSSHLSPRIPDELDRARISRESTPGPYAVHPRVCRLGFDTEITHSTRGFVFGSRPDANVKMSYHGDISETTGNYFRIHYNFESGALLIMAMERIRIGTIILKKDESLLLLASMSIHCGRGDQKFEFTIEFPELTQCADQHELNYREYVQRLGVPTAPYLVTLRNEDPPIGHSHRSKTLLGKGSFGEVHLAVHVRTGASCAIKLLARKDEKQSTRDQLNEVKILSRLSHSNIIQYHEAFEFNGQICIKMELAANDLLKHRDAKKGNKQTFFLSLRCIRSVGRQALLAIEYLHEQGVTHRDLKPENILVTRWDPKTDLPTIKLADFGLASLNYTHGTICGTPDWLAPELEEARKKWLELQQRNKERGTKAAMPSIRYDNSVDIWALGKILNLLVSEVPSHTVIRRRLMPVNKGPPARLINNMMRLVPTERPTAWQCLLDPWMVSEDCYNAQVAKRDRSPTPGQSSRHPIKKTHQNPLEPFSNTEEGSTTILLSALWPHRPDHFTMSYNKRSREMTVQRNSTEMLNPSGSQQNIPEDPMQVDHLTIKPDAEGQLAIRAQCGNGTVLHGSLAFQYPSTAMSILRESDNIPQHSSAPKREIAEILLAMAKRHESNEEEAVRKGIDQLHITTSQIQYRAGNPMIEGAEISLYNGSLPVIVVDGENTSEAPSHGARGLYDGEHHLDQAYNTSVISNSCWGSGKSKPVTYPTECDDVMAGLTFVLPRS